MASIEERVRSLEDTLRNDFALPFKEVMLEVSDHMGLLRDLKHAVYAYGGDIHSAAARLDIMDTRLGAMDIRLNSMEKTIATFKGEVGEKFRILREQMNLRFDSLKQEIGYGRAEIDQQFADVDEKFSALRLEMDQHFAQIDQKIDQVIALLSQKGKESA